MAHRGVPIDGERSRGLLFARLVESLAERIARHGPLGELDAIGWAIRLAKRIEVLHARGVVHGSVSPACIVAAGQDRSARAYLADAQQAAPLPAYRSPERVLGGAISTTDDVWGLAATLYALLTGQSPFSGGSEVETDQKILAAAPPPLAAYDVGDDDLQQLLDRAFAREIGQRTTSVAAVRRALEDWHPDRRVVSLPALDDGEPPGGDGVRPPTLGGVPRMHQDDDDDDDTARTVTRAVPVEEGGSSGNPIVRSSRRPPTALVDLEIGPSPLGTANPARPLARPPRGASKVAIFFAAVIAMVVAAAATFAWLKLKGV